MHSVKVTWIQVLSFTEVSFSLFPPDGVLWTAGSGSYGELGHHYDQNRPIFSPVQDIPAVSQVAIGRHHSVVLTREGDVSIP